MENKIMAALFRDRDAYELLKPIVREKPTSIFSDISGILYERISDYYENDREASFIDLDVIRSYIARVFPKQEDILSIAIDEIESTPPVSCNNIISEFLLTKRHALGQQLAAALLSGKDPGELLDEYNLLYSGSHNAGEEDVVVYNQIRSKDITSFLDRSNVIKVLPEELNSRIDGVMKGDHILIYARPEAGKSLFAINMVRGFLEQDLKVLYIGNEDSPKRMLPRFLCSLVGITRKELEELSMEGLDHTLDTTKIDNLYFVHLEPGTFPQIRGLIRRLEPDVVVVDQIRNVQTGSDGLTVGLERAGTEMRNIAAEFDVVAVSLTQAGESANGKLRLDKSDVDSSKTGLPAQIDVMVGIGVNEEYENRGKRMISLPKNKVTGDHSFFSVDVKENMSRVDD